MLDRRRLGAASPTTIDGVGLGNPQERRRYSNERIDIYLLNKCPQRGDYRRFWLQASLAEHSPYSASHHESDISCRDQHPCGFQADLT